MLSEISMLKNLSEEILFRSLLHSIQIRLLDNVHHMKDSSCIQHNLFGFILIVYMKASVLPCCLSVGGNRPTKDGIDNIILI